MRNVTFASLLLCACGDGSGSGSGPSDAGSDAGDAAVPCPYAHVMSTNGRLTGPGGDLPASASVGFCMHNDVTSVCLQPMLTAADGTYTIEVPAKFSCVHEAADRLLGDGMAVGYCALDVDGIDGNLTAPDFALFALEGPAPDWGAGADDEIAYTADDGAQLTLRRSDVVVRAVETDLRMTWIDTSIERPCFLPEGQEVATLYAIGPESLVVREGGLPARLVDHSGLPAGTPVDLYTVGSILTAFGANAILEGEWHAFAESTVGADGFIDTPAGAGVPQLGWVGAVAQ